MSATRTEPPSAHTIRTGLSDSTHSSTSSASAERYQLDQEDTNPILLYTYRGKLETSSQKDLCARLDKDEKLRATRKQIPRATSYLDVRRHDLYLPDEKQQYADLPNYDSSLASVKIPSLAYWSRMILGNYQDLFIVSPETTPTSSVADDGSRRTSPTSTWGQDSEASMRQVAA
ncbi:unnamed protein product [Zymoseptoria tritici ST99CH_1A5]|uniref:Uncharacterized protein n=4 Tax=Zymoseptoria tritici TaxID=1047171 RepID=F9XD14_ZYMTI|nr:uncharacterized protein MYCGRDRAFT_104795 [Zymoseptoria tritici IPO323]SMQ51601.1 unnamed protein product [Zymoseptoria tritici ST99CH_3D7]SMR53745.1 unnamed protein product [Zymoseptoria tritici ST99CH_1E4]SMR56061.1 unnamed protein product [Zymoseptoria tritici ST99CH_3D1]SMY25248.1 unnamed protein product [Zymoseptoria tritici ST99CH_1A5]EGP86407.1 hypothetical protein MYCGRDRAFT_104795 [Zymoseptoria tritici IPO323]